MRLFEDIAKVRRRIEQISRCEALPQLPIPEPAAFEALFRSGTDPKPNIERLIQSGASAWRIDPALVKAVIANESGFDPNATSQTGAQGLMQLEPGTSAELGVANAYDPAQNIWGGSRYLRGLLERFHGDLRLAIAAYNAGPGAVEKYGGVPPYAQTQAYVENVLATYHKYKQR